MKKQTISDPERKIDSAPADVSERAQYWIIRLASREMERQELERLEAWLAEDDSHASAFARERALWQDLDAVSDSFQQYNIVAPGMRPAAVQKRPRISRRRIVRAIPLALTASLVAMFFGPTLLIEMQSDFRTGAGEIRSIELSDGSTVLLDSATAIAVNIEGERRVVQLLKGGAWFQVQHESRPFLVEAMDGVTRDVGTAFEVQREEEAVQVSVTEGAVEVQNRASDAIFPLKAGQRARYSDDGLVPMPSRPVATLASWRNGEILFDQQDVEGAILKIARYRNPPVWLLGDFDALLPVSGVFLISRPDEALKTIARMRDLQMIELPGGIVILRTHAK